jgi:hypothetical protein
MVNINTNTKKKYINMKTLTINNRELKYRIFWHSSKYGECEWTEFYEGTTTKTYKRFCLFGKETTVVKPKYVFTIYRDIEDKSYTKKQVRDWIQYELDLLNREDEIMRGEII